MITSAAVAEGTVPRVGGYACEAYAWSAELGRRWVLGRHVVRTPRLAVRWLRGRALLIAHALDPLPEHPGPLPAACLREIAGGGPNPGALMRRWLHDAGAQETAADRLRTGLPLTVGAADESVHYVLAAQPLPA
ncbi:MULTISPECIES: hypothetical protein [Streptomyces]|uniref:hypothetical protein n=1 Tax=Streptomyces TaxID=1883 RepID=UPI002248DB1A|nr:hypothetical protein [Streptomyces sp. JHD 1]MCX2969264.1 hypothetical protein [Streptomyces sp. JHD 1]